jgi:hypothetical protein
MFRKFNQWYDSVKEPRRFFYLLGYAVPMLFLLYSNTHILMLLGVAMLVTVSAVALSRIW